MQDQLADFVPRMTRAILAADDVNVIMVNWVSGANLEYDQSAQNTRVVGAVTAYLMKVISVKLFRHVPLEISSDLSNAFQESFDYDPQNFHVIGFSLGAHVAGFSGKEFQRHHADHAKIGRISGKLSLLERDSTITRSLPCVNEN